MIHELSNNEKILVFGAEEGECKCSYVGSVRSIIIEYNLSDAESCKKHCCNNVVMLSPLCFMTEALGGYG